MYGCITFPWVNIINICLVFSTTACVPLHLQKVSLFCIWTWELVFFLSRKDSYPRLCQYWLHNLNISCICVFSVITATYLTFSVQDVKKLSNFSTHLGVEKLLLLKLAMNVKLHGYMQVTFDESHAQVHQIRFESSKYCLETLCKSSLHNYVECQD
jgi:hypothetical protein